MTRALVFTLGPYRLLAGAERDDQLAAVPAHRDRFAAVLERGDLGIQRAVDEKILSQAAAQRESKLGGALALAERDGVGSFADGDRCPGDGFRPADRELHALARPGMPDRNEVGVRRFKDRREPFERDVPHRRSHEIPAFDP